MSACCHPLRMRRPRPHRRNAQHASTAPLPTFDTTTRPRHAWQRRQGRPSGAGAVAQRWPWQRRQPRQPPQRPGRQGGVSAVRCGAAGATAGGRHGPARRACGRPAAPGLARPRAGRHCLAAAGGGRPGRGLAADGDVCAQDHVWGQAGASSASAGREVAAGRVWGAVL